MVRIIDWVQILLDLRSVKISTVKLAEQVGAGRTKVQSLMYGIEPKYSLGRAILDIHAEHCQAKADKNNAIDVGKPEVE